MTTDNKATESDNLEMLLGDTVPDKFRGKPVKDVLKSYTELESAYSRQGKELGEVRRLATTLSELEVQTSTKAEQRVPVDTEMLLADPDKAINDVIDSHPAVREARNKSDQLERQLAITEFEKKHPSFREAAVSEDFKAWVDSSPAVRRLAVAADKYDLDAADTLFTLWTEKQGYREQAEATQKINDNKKAQERAGTLEGASGADASSESTYSRADFQELQRRALLGDKTAMAKWKDPKFQALRHKAYKDKRVS